MAFENLRPVQSVEEFPEVQASQARLLLTRREIGMLLLVIDVDAGDDGAGVWA